MSCSMIAAEMPVDRTTEVTVSMIGVFSRVLTPLVGSSRNRSFGRSAYAMATSRSLRSPCETPPASIRALGSSPKRRRISSASSHTARSALASEASRRVLPAREDRQRDVVEHGQLVEEVHELEAPRDPGADAPVHRLAGHVLAPKQDAPAVG